MLDSARLNSSSNLLLGYMAQTDRDLLGRHLQPMELKVPDVLKWANEPQRPGVTIAVGELENNGLIQAKRGLISILDRPSLVEMTKGFYGVAEKEYQRRFAELH